MKVAGVTSKSAESRDAFARDRGVPAFASFELLCDAVDVIDICAPGSVHEPLAVAALERGKHVVIEKPFTGYYRAVRSERATLFAAISFPRK